MSVEPEVEYRPEGEFTQEIGMPAETDEGGLGTARPTTDTASQYTIEDKQEATASNKSQEVATSSSITQTPRTSTHHSKNYDFFYNLLS